MLKGTFRVACGGTFHTVEIDEEGNGSSPNDDHDLDLEFSLVAIGAKPAGCLAWILEHGDVVVSAREAMLWELFYLVFDSDQALIHYGEETETGVSLPLSAYEAGMDLTDGLPDSMGMSNYDQYTMRQKAQELGVEVESYSSGVYVAGELSLNLYPGLKDVMPGDAIVLAQGTAHDHAQVNIEESWVDHGVLENDEYDLGDESRDNALATVEFYYHWAVYTTRKHVDEVRREKLYEDIDEKFSEIDSGLNQADNFASEDQCDSALGALAEDVYPAYKALDEMLAGDEAEEDVLQFSHDDIRSLAKIVNLDLTWLQEIEHSCDVKPPGDVLRARHAVLGFFQKVWKVVDDTDEAARVLIESLNEDEE